MGAIFRIDDVSELTSDDLCIVELSLAGAYDPNLDRLFTYYRRELDETSIYTILAKLLRTKSNDISRAELYCAHLFNNPTADKGIVYYQGTQNLGM